jgi:hypothetical protein
MRCPLFALALSLVAGCSNSPGSSATPDLAPSPPDLAAQHPLWTTTVRDIQTMNVLAGVSVCIAPANTVCNTTNASGSVTFSAPKNSQFLLSYSLANYVQSYTEHTSTTVDDYNNFLLASVSTQGALSGALSKTVDPSKGNLVLSVVDTQIKPLAGVKFSLTPVAGDGPYYFGPFLPDKTVTSTSSNGLGLVLNLAAADYDITASLAGKSCAGLPANSWQGQTATSAKGRVIVGGITAVTFLCQ